MLFSLQLHGAIDYLFDLVACLLYLLIIGLTFSTQLYLSKTVFLLNILCSLLDFGKYFPNKWKNTFVTILVIVVGLIFLRLFPVFPQLSLGLYSIVDL